MRITTPPKIATQFSKVLMRFFALSFRPQGATLLAQKIIGSRRSEFIKTMN